MFTHGKLRPNSFFGAVALMVGTAVGAGIFALPYTFAKAGTLVGVVYLVVLGSILLLVNLAYGEIAISTEGDHQYTAYVERYLGKRWKVLSLFSMCLGFYGALSAYTVEVSTLLQELLAGVIPLTRIQFGLIYIVCVGLALLIGLRAVTAVDKVLMLVMLGLIATFVIIGIPHINLDNLEAVHPTALFLPYGVVLFALTAASAVPDMKRVLHNEGHLLKRAILIGSSLPVIIYIIFSIVAVGITGQGTTESSILGLGEVLGPSALVLGGIFGCITMTTAFLVLGLALREMYQLDMKIHGTIAWLLVLIPPLLMLLLNLLSFVEILGMSGAIVGGIDGIVIMHMHRRLRLVHHLPSSFTVSQSVIVHTLAYAVFLGGIAYETWIIFQRLS
jgi:tyrosine-specific transport protein